MNMKCQEEMVETQRDTENEGEIVNFFPSL